MFFCSLKSTPPKTEVQSGKIPFAKGKSSLKATWLCVQKLLSVSGDVYFVPWQNHHKTHQIHGHLEGVPLWQPQVLGDSTQAKGSKGDAAAPVSQTVAKEVCGSVDEEVNCDGKKNRVGQVQWWFQIFYMFIPICGKISNLTNVFQMGWNHQPEKQCGTSSVK